MIIAKVKIIDGDTGRVYHNNQTILPVETLAYPFSTSYEFRFRVEVADKLIGLNANQVFYDEDAFELFDDDKEHEDE